MAALRFAGRTLRRPARCAQSGEPLRILAHVPYFPPVRRAGSEVSIATTLAILGERGNEIRVVVAEAGTTGQPPGLGVVARPDGRELNEHYQWCDVVLTQLASRNPAMRRAALHRRPVVQFLHMGSIDRATCLGEPDLLVFNAEWLRAATPWNGPKTVLHPPIAPEAVRTTPGESVTLVNLNEVKGSDVFYELARARPATSFLGVIGEWGSQTIPDDLPPNVSLSESVSDMREIFSRTRVLLMPSRQETYGRVGLEAACSGIPTIASPLEGLREALGDAAVYAEWSDIPAWLQELDQLDDPAYYRARSDAALARAAAIDAPHDVEQFERRLRALVVR